MLTAGVRRITVTAVKKVAYMDNHLLGYFILAALAGIYVGFGIILIFSVGGPFAIAGSAAAKLLMWASFGVALTLMGPGFTEVNVAVHGRYRLMDYRFSAKFHRGFGHSQPLVSNAGMNH